MEISAHLVTRSKESNFEMQFLLLNITIICYKKQMFAMEDCSTEGRYALALPFPM